ncbi:MAG: lipopolysaccharide biosynthesis protein [Planctomycetota bacterium]|jgi:O-antigen/teichoic acid export membrane protein
MTREQRRNPSSIARNSLVMTAGFTVTSGFMFLTDLAVIHAYGPTAHGQVTLALSVAIMGALLCDLGLASKAGVRTIASLRAAPGPQLGSSVGRSMTTLLIAGLLAAVVLNVAVPVLATQLDVPPFALRQASIWLFAGAGMRAAAMVFTGFERMVYVAVLFAIAEGARLCWTVLCELLNLDVTYLYTGWSAIWLGSLVVSMACVATLLRRMGVRIDWWPYRLREAARETWRGLAYLPPMLTNQALPPLLFLLVGFTLDAQGTDASGAADRLSVLKVCFSLALVLRIVSQAMATSLFPVVARQSSVPGEAGLGPALERSFGLSVRVLAMCAAGALALFVVLGRPGLGLLDAFNGTSIYVTGLPTLLILTVAVAVDSYRVQVDQLLMGTRHVRVVVIGELAKTALLLAAIPAGVLVSGGHAETGSAAALLVTVLVIAVWRAWWATRLLGGAGSRAAGLGLLALAVVGATAALPGGVYAVVPLALLVVAVVWLTRPRAVAERQLTPPNGRAPRSTGGADRTGS